MKGYFPFLSFRYTNFIESLYYVYFNKLFYFNNNPKDFFNKGKGVAVYFSNSVQCVIIVIKA